LGWFLLGVSTVFKLKYEGGNVDKLANSACRSLTFIFFVVWIEIACCSICCVLDGLHGNVLPIAECG
jgi:hypothetical protein